MSTPRELLEALGRDARANLESGRVAPAGVATRTYRARSVEDIIPMIQRDLGAEAIIVRRRDGLTGGVLGFFQHPYVEIEAMEGAPSIDVYDEDEPASPPSFSTAGEASPDQQPPPPQQQPAQPVQPAPPAPQARPVPQPQLMPPLPLARPTFQAPPTQPMPPPMPQARPAPQPPPMPQARPVPQPPPMPRPQPMSQRPPMSQPRPAPQARPMPPTRPMPPALQARAAPQARPTPSPLPPPVQPGSPTPGSAYVTAHLAALARAGRQAGGAAGADGGLAPPPLPREQATSAVDFHELTLREEPQQFAEIAEPVAPEYPPMPRRAAPERRTVAPGSHGRASAGIERRLCRFGISEELARELIDGAGAHALPLAPRSGLVQAVRATLSQRMPVAPALPIRGAAIVVVGAGGAGKTTCCAALLGAYRKSSTLPASFATLTRGGERGELRLILSPRIVKPTPAGSARALSALRRAKSDGMAVLDTPRLSPADKAGIRELALLLGELKPERIVVALPATLGAAAAAQLLSALSPLGANALAVTHAEETDQIGVAIEAACRFGLAPEYMLDRGRSGGWRLSRIDPTELAAKLLQ